jgi:molybdopterin converting factor subunit 1
MRVTVRLFARLRDIAGEGTLDLDIPPGAAAQAVWDALAHEFPEFSRYSGITSCAVNEEYAKFTTTLHEGDEVAFLPPVSGGGESIRD